MADFRARFCEYYRCSADEYRRRALRECLYSGARLLLPILWHTTPIVFESDLQFLERLGKANSLKSALDRIADFRSDTVVYRGFMRTKLKIRLSSRRMEEVAYALFDSSSTAED